jgi:hypothetical protein
MQNTSLVLPRKVNCCEGINRVVVDALVPSPKTTNYSDHGGEKEYAKSISCGPSGGESMCTCTVPP